MPPVRITTVQLADGFVIQATGIGVDLARQLAEIVGDSPRLATLDFQFEIIIFLTLPFDLILSANKGNQFGAYVDDVRDALRDATLRPFQERGLPPKQIGALNERVGNRHQEYALAMRGVGPDPTPDTLRHLGEAAWRNILGTTTPNIHAAFLLALHFAGLMKSFKEIGRAYEIV